MKFKAVIFDLFGTLVDFYKVVDYNNTLVEMAAILNVPYREFRRIWDDTAPERNTGAFTTTNTSIAAICNRMDVQVDDDMIERAANIRREFVTRTLSPRHDTLSTLAQLKEKGIKIGLISNCSPDTPETWDQTPFPSLFDVTIFSTSARIKKPDPRIYRLALDGLGVAGEDCIYVGDGDSNELTGAQEMSMHPVMISVDYEKDNNLYVYNRQEWDGPVISSLTEIVNLLEDE
ncbi:MAG: HAD family hydrolase [Dehalococcoidales bacterium]|nr:MAG: HAD family hydrolase [Dehalococcoidales bacterium]